MRWDILAGEWSATNFYNSDKTGCITVYLNGKKQKLYKYNEEVEKINNKGNRVLLICNLKWTKK